MNRLASCAVALLLAGCQADDPAPVTPGSGTDVATDVVADEECGDAVPCDDDEALRMLGFPIAVPAYLPEGAELVEVAMQPGELDLSDAGGDLAYYWRHYRAGDACFTVEGGVLEGLGGPGFENETAPIELPAGFASFTEGVAPAVRWNGPGPEEGLAPNALRADELMAPGSAVIGYTLTSNAGASLDPDLYHQQPADCEMLDPEEARRVMASLEVMEGTGA